MYIVVDLGGQHEDVHISLADELRLRKNVEVRIREHRSARERRRYVDILALVTIFR